jgi:hypothetical protein
MNNREVLGGAILRRPGSQTKTAAIALDLPQARATETAVVVKG